MISKYFKSDKYFDNTPSTKSDVAGRSDVAGLVDEFKKSVNDYADKRQVRSKIIKKRYAPKQD